MVMWGRNTFALLGLLVGFSCADRDLPGEDADEVLRCAYVHAVIEQDDGSRIILPDTASEVCDCVRMEDALNPEFTGPMQDAAYEECVGLVEDAGLDPAQSDCLDKLERGTWINTFPPGSIDNEFPPCSSLGPDAGCGR